MGEERSKLQATDDGLVAGENGLRKLKVVTGDAVIHIDGKTGVATIYADIGEKVISEATLLALALYWALENEDWRYKVTRRAAERVQDIVDEEQDKVKKGRSRPSSEGGLGRPSRSRSSDEPHRDRGR